MAFNAFNGVALSADEAELAVSGHTNEPFAATRIEAAIVDTADEDRRLQGVCDATGPSTENTESGR